MNELKILPPNILTIPAETPLRPRRKLNILLGDPHHAVGVKNVAMMPIGIGYIGSYTRALLGAGNVEISLLVEPDEIIAKIKTGKPDVVALSNYCWNTELSGLILKIAKKTLPNVICVAGGPDFPLKTERRLEYLEKRKQIDFYAYQEGEGAFANLMSRVMAVEDLQLEDLKAEEHEGMIAINPRTGELVVGKPKPRAKNLDYIPSPYLDGSMDQWFDGQFAPSLETSRGCPFTCNFCEAAASWYTPVSTFSLERMRREFSYIAERMYQHPGVLMAIHDSNFGMYERDEEVARIIRALQDEYDWPRAFQVTTGKGNYDRILDIMAVLRNQMVMSTSVQSLNPDTLKIIERKNPPPAKLNLIFAEIKRRGISTTCELILPMPMETKDSFFAAVRTLLNARVDQILPYTTMLFKGTELASFENRREYAMTSKFRLLPRQYGEYDGYKCFEIEEVCVATSTMPFEDYMECRGFALIATILSNTQFDVITRHLIELGIDIYEFNMYVWNLVKSGNTTMSRLYLDYLRETQEELADSPQDIIDYYTEQENYNRLASGETGDNKIRKYRTNAFLEETENMAELIYTAIGEMLGPGADPSAIDSLAAAKKWILATRLIGGNINEAQLDKPLLRFLELPYDVSAWYNAGASAKPLVTYHRPVLYKIRPDKEQISQIMDDGKKLFGNSISFVIDKMIIHFSVKSFWCKTEAVLVK
jgi:radical SAM superfamily enzyme YgiQ (UPF0313 family)